MNKPYNKSCTECGGIQSYTTKKHLSYAIRNKLVCKSCASKRRISCLSDVEMDKRLIALHCGLNVYHTNNNNNGNHSKVVKDGYTCDVKNQMSLTQQNRYASKRQRKLTSEAIKKAMHRPDIRQNHINALSKSKWIKVKCDVGQIELLEKWNRLGFNFQPNYQVKTKTDLFYVDGYDVERNVVLEYDSKYHKKRQQTIKDYNRQQIIIDSIKPAVFFRYDACSKEIKEVYRANEINKN